MNEIGKHIYSRIWFYFLFSAIISGISLAAYYVFKFNPYLLSIILIIIFLIIRTMINGWDGWGNIIGLFIGYTIINLFTVFFGLIKDSFWNSLGVLVAMLLIGLFLGWLYEKIA